MDKNAWLILLSQNPTTRFWKIDFSELSLPEQVFVSIWELEGEVNNGGFSQYYSNSAGDNAPLVPSMLRAIGADKMARIVEEANAVFGSAGPPKNQEERQQIIESFTPATAEKFDELDTQFMRYPDNLTERLYDYIQSHIDQIKGL